MLLPISTGESMKYTHIGQIIGDTPLLEIDPSIHGLKNVRLYAKLEYMNPFGSVKDRIARGMLEPILDDVVKNNKTILEASSGNTAKALAALCGTYGIPTKSITNRIKAPEVRMILQTLDVELEELPGMSDCPDPSDPNNFTNIAKQYAEQHPDTCHYTDQFYNKNNIDSHRTTGKEIADDLSKVDYFYGVLGTCGTTLGAGGYLREKQDTTLVGVVAEAGHQVPGGRNLSELQEYGFYKESLYDALTTGTSPQAVDGMLTLNRQCGIMCGPTAGLIYHCAVEHLKKHQPKDDEEPLTAVFIACDRMEPYMSFVRQFRPDVFSTLASKKQTVYTVSPEEVANAPTIDAQELHKQCQSNTPPRIIDIRSSYGFSVGHIKNSTNITDHILADMLEGGEVFPKNEPLVIVCRVGRISQSFAAHLSRLGYDAASLSGGTSEWKAQDLPMETIA